MNAANRGDRHRRNNSSISANSGETPGLLNLLNNLNSGIKAQHERRRTGSWDDSDITRGMPVRLPMEPAVHRLESRPRSPGEAR